jgi:hypothetical protein
MKKQHRLKTEDKVALADDYDEGLKAGKNSKGLLGKMRQKYGRSPRQIERYVAEGRRLREETVSLPNTTSLAPPDIIAVRRREKHHREMLSFVQTWWNGLDHALWCHPIRDFDGPGVHFSVCTIDPPHDLIWRVTDGGDILLSHVTKKFNHKQEDILRGQVYQHFESWKESSLFDDSMSWARICGNELVVRAQVLRMIDIAVKESTSALTKDGFSRATGWFSATVLAALVDGVNLKYHVMEITESDKVYFIVRHGPPGPAPIAWASDNRTARLFQEIHQGMISAASAEILQACKQVRMLIPRRARAMRIIEEGLGGVIIDGFVEGRCRRCP